ncbi:MAG: GAF domain-containing protein [Betaproteobacteria bacterium]|nr:GAF domain-containing protein [Betaproteobacteria bacterium]
MSDTVPVSPSTEPGPLPAAREPARRVHPVVYIDYRIRIIGYLVTGATVASTLLEARPGARAATALLWALLLAQTFLWPHLAFLLARGSRRPQTVEKATLAADGFLGGVWLVLIGLPLWPATVVVFTLLISATSVGGARMLGACMAALAAGGLAAAAGAGFTFIPDTGLVTAFICIAGILAYGASYAATLKRQARSLSAADQEKAALFDEVQQHGVALARSLERLQALHEVTKAISSSIELQVVLDAVVRHAVRVAGADAGAIVEVEAGATVFRSLAHQNLSPGFHEKLAGIRVDTQDRVIREAIDGKKPVQVPDLDAEDRFLLRDAAIADGFHGLLAVPIVQARITRGLMLLRRARGPFDPDSVELLVALGAQAAVAIENAGLYRQLQAQQRSLEIASRAKSDFMANMSHELRTPLNAILGYTELMLDGVYGDAPERMQPVLKRVDRSARHLLGMIDEVLDIAKIEAGTLRLHLAPCALSDLIREVVVAMEALAQEKGLRLRATLPAEGLPLLEADERQLSQVLFNLVGNAIKFTERGEVEVSVTLDCRRLVVTVRDTGRGVDSADQARIFEEFQQAAGAPGSPRDGAGLGLAIARRIVELHGGKLWVESAPGAGSTFSFSLPLAAADAAPPAAVTSVERTP